MERVGQGERGSVVGRGGGSQSTGDKRRGSRVGEERVGMTSSNFHFLSGRYRLTAPTSQKENTLSVSKYRSVNSGINQMERSNSIDHFVKKKNTLFNSSLDIPVNRITDVDRKYQKGNIPC